MEERWDSISSGDEFVLTWNPKKSPQVLKDIKGQVEALLAWHKKYGVKKQERTK